MWDLHLPTKSNQLKHWICFFFNTGFFVLELNKKITIDSDFIRSTEYPRII